MRRALELASYAVESGCGGPFGAVVARADGDAPGAPRAIWAEGYNRVLVDDDPTAHAEIVAIRRACERLGSFQLAGFELYASCEPCPMCLSAALWARVDRVVFAAGRADAAAAGFDDARFYAELERLPSERSLPLVQFLASEAGEAFQAWRDKADRTPY